MFDGVLGGAATLFPPTLQDKYERLHESLRALRSVAVAFSAGVDSTLVLRVARDVLGPGAVVAVTGRSPSVPPSELVEASELARGVGVRHVFLDTDEFENPNYLSNPTNRCYYCKTTLYRHLAQFLLDNALQAAINGTNADDLGDYRPGLRAGEEFQVRSPLAEVGLTKSEVRELSRGLGLPTFDKPASPCLSSRVPYGDAITPEKLRMIDAAEGLLRELGARECRVRHHGLRASIEVAPEFFERVREHWVRIEARLRALGYEQVTLDPRGFRSGRLNELIPLGVTASCETTTLERVFARSDPSV